MAIGEKILADTSIPEGIEAVDIVNLNNQRRVQAADFGTYNLAPYLSQLPDERETTYEALVTAEQQLASRDLTLQGYRNGVAEKPDQLKIENGSNRVVITAEHATDQYRLQKDGTRAWKEAEPGTAALGWILHEDLHTGFISPLGRQTGDANNDPEHKLKEAMRPLLLASKRLGHFSLHGTGRSQASSIMDAKSYSALLGIGYNPSPETIDTVDKILEIAKTYELRIGVNQETLRFAPDRTLRYRSDGTPSRITFAASNENTTRSFAQRTAEELARPLVAIQFELSDVFRVLPLDHADYPGERSQHIGTHICVLFMKDCVRLLQEGGEA